MKMNVKTISEFFDSLEEYKEIGEFIDQTIQQTPLYKDRGLHQSESVVLLGYGFKPYKNTCYDGVWPLIGMAKQKNSLNLYVMIYKDGKSILDDYKDIFGKSNVGVGCIRIKKMNEIRKKAIEDIIAVANKEIEK